MAGQFLNGGPSGPEKPKLMADINITPMVDVMLVLLVIFMVTAPLLVAGVNVDLPKTAAPKIAQLQKPVIVTLAADGGLYIGDESVALSGLEERLFALKPQDGDATVYLRADRKAVYGEVLALLGQIEHAGFQRISLLSQAADSPLPVKSAP
jgi:biopolymer transport protein ExbD